MTREEKERKIYQQAGIALGVALLVDIACCWWLFGCYFHGNEPGSITIGDMTIPFIGLPFVVTVVCIATYRLAGHFIWKQEGQDD